MSTEIQKHLRFNITVNLLDGAFFGLAMGFASFVTVIPLFVNTMTTSATLIGLIPAIHSVGWQLPQLFLASRVASLPRVKKMVMFWTLHERLPFLGLAILAYVMSGMGISTALVITFLLLTWQGLGGGLAANPWQNMIVRIIPSDLRGTFLGGQAAAANLLASMSAILAGIILEKLPTPLDFALCFFLASIAIMISFGWLALTREPAIVVPESEPERGAFWKGTRAILQKDANFRWFLAGRSLVSFATTSFSFFTVYAVHQHHVSEATIGIMTSVLMGTQIAANPIMGWLGDRWNRRYTIEIGLVASIASTVIAMLAPSPAWFYLVFFLAGIGIVGLWTVSLAMSMEFGTDAERPVYIGLANTLVAPSAILAPFIGGWLADTAGYGATFLMTIVSGVITIVVFHLVIKNPGMNGRHN